MKIVNKVLLCVISVLYYIKYTVLYHKSITFHAINSIRGKFRVEIFHGGKVQIGRFLMSRGPLYIKCTEKGYLHIGDKCFFNHNCSITCANKISIGDGCMFANNLVIIDHDHKVADGKICKELLAEPVIIENNVWCGANVTILKGVHIGEGAIIAAGAVVTKNVKAHTVVAGVPARVVRSIK